jgi:hypothetical protein
MPRLTRSAVCDQDPRATPALGLVLDRAQALPPHLKALLAKPQVTEDGFVILEGFAARAANVQHYPANPIGLQYAYRPPEEVFAPESLDSWRSKPIPVLHPSDRGDRKALLDPDNVALHQGGTVMDVEALPEHNLVKVRMLLTTKEAIEAVMPTDGREPILELSAGYRRDIDPTPGTAADGSKYDHIQRNIRVNHLALVPTGRAGSLARVAIDSQPPEDPMEFVMINGVRVHKDDAKAFQAALDAAAASAQATTDAAEAARETAVAERDAAVAEAAAHKAELDALRKAEDARALVTLTEEAKALLPEGTVTDGKTKRQLQEAVIKHALPDVALDGAAEVAVAAYYDAAKRVLKAGKAQVASTNAATRPPAPGDKPETDAAPDPRAARDAWLQAQKQPTISA